MDLGSRVAYAEGVLSHTVDGEAVMVELSRGAYYGLNAVGNRIWELVGERGRVGDILDALLAEYDVARDVAERDLLALLEQLEARGLVRRLP